MDLLAGFDEGWTVLLKQLLAEDPPGRLPLPELSLQPAMERTRRVRRSYPKTALAFVVGLALLACAVWLCLKSRPQRYDFDEFFPPVEEVAR